jgi:hypothetical protein
MVGRFVSGLGFSHAKNVAASATAFAAEGQGLKPEPMLERSRGRAEAKP